MNAGYVRLSRDDDKRNYVSIENQKLIINQFAAESNMVSTAGMRMMACLDINLTDQASIS